MFDEYPVRWSSVRGLRLSRRQALAGSAAAIAVVAAGRSLAQDAPPAETPAVPEAAPAPVNEAPVTPEVPAFSYDSLTAAMKAASQQPYHAPAEVQGFDAQLSYDDFRNIRFRPENARWAGPDAAFTLQAFHLGWLFKQPVAVHEIVDGKVQEFTFTADDFLFENEMAGRLPADYVLPGVAGFRVHAPLNQRGVYDEVIAFLGASYFRAVGRGTSYGLSARGLAVNTAVGGEEEFPRFSEFWLERPAPDADRLVFFAALESPSVTGAFRFVLVPGETTRVDVTARLFFRAEVRQLGVAPLTSMYLFGPNDRGPFDDYRRQVHDSDMLLVESGTERFVRPLNNPPRLANSYLSVDDPVAFGLVQRVRDFDAYLDAGARYERRPSLLVEPIGNWGQGMVRLIEIPSDLESNDNIVAFWVPSQPVAAGDERAFSYRLHWGAAPLDNDPRFARVLRTLAGTGGFSGGKTSDNVRKFAVDFAGGPLAELSRGAGVEVRVSAVNGEVIDSAVTRIDETDIWRVVLDVSAQPGAVVELQAALFLEDRQLSETWLYQWMKE